MLVTWLENVAPRWPTARTFRRGEAATNSVAALGGPAGPVMQVRTAVRSKMSRLNEHHYHLHDRVGTFRSAKNSVIPHEP